MTQYAAKLSRFCSASIGQDIQGSRTPEMHMREGEAQGLRLVYRLIDLTQARARRRGPAGAADRGERTGLRRAQTSPIPASRR